MNTKERYLVLKKSDIDRYLSDETRMDLAQMEICIEASRINDRKQPLRCVVIEAGTNVDEATFKSLEAVVIGGEEVPQCPASQR